ncbi:hypothetical protein QBC35DRAFT_382177 [Podospora australis]|uniref:DUF8004 domain-containing protein n=1 Tax=Podospora australis TaxID=1536484 RepID=A0AAN7AJS5_9PEZI|nr:hypothetical protein QBC35DRAFT_382177 [Podospora australis]
MDQTLSVGTSIKRWDGAEYSCMAWDGLKRDAELWSRDGNCLVYLHERGERQEGPSFKVNLDVLLAAKCHPLVAKFAIRHVPDWSTSDVEEAVVDDLVGDTRQHEVVELYIPSPPASTRVEARSYHLAIRNLFAWVFRRPVVGENLGTALISLLHSLKEFRCPDEDSMVSILGYMDEESYLDMPNRPYHALAMLHFAEHFQLRDLYMDAMCHCVGMSGQLSSIPEYQVINSATRKIIRHTRLEMNNKLRNAGQMLRNFLENDLPESQIRLTSGQRSHLKHFRTFLTAFFTKRLGRYPPTSADPPGLVFERDVYTTMRDDLDALYHYLADTTFTTQILPTLEQIQAGGPVLQIIHGFDQRNKYPSLLHPLPLIPEAIPKSPTRLISWLTRGDKPKPDQRLVSNAALIKATNKQKHIASNELVAAYRKFEEDSVFFPHRMERNEKLSHADMRTARWTVIYCLDQVLRDCAQCPPECRNMTDVKYNIAIKSENITPPWAHMEDFLSLTDVCPPVSSPGTPQNPAVQRQARLSVEFKPPVSGRTPLAPALALQKTTPPAEDLLSQSSTLAAKFNLKLDTGSSIRKCRTPSISPRTSLTGARPYINRTPSPASGIQLAVGTFGKCKLRASCHTFGTIDHYSMEDLKPLPLSVCDRPASRGSLSSSNDASETSQSKDSEASTALTAPSLNPGFDETRASDCPVADYDSDTISPLSSAPNSRPNSPTLLNDHRLGRSNPFTPPENPRTQFQSRASNEQETRAPQGDNQECQQQPQSQAMEGLKYEMKNASSYSIRTLASSVYSQESTSTVGPPPPLPKKSSRRKLPGLHPRPLRIRKMPPSVGASRGHARDHLSDGGY